MSPTLRIVFAGTPDFSVPALQALIASPHQVIGVYTQPDRPAGRGRKLTPSPVKQAAIEAGIPVYQPASLKDAAAVDELASLAPDLMVVVAYGLLLPQRVLDIPRLGCVNIHASLLPRWRGAAPIQRAILSGDRVTGVAIMRMEAGLDTGPVYLSRETPIEPGETGGELHDRLSTLGAEALTEALPGIADGSLQPVPQADEGTLYAHKIAKTEGEIDWQATAEAIDRRVRAFNPWPVAYTTHEGATLRVWQAEPVEGQAGDEPGRVMASDRNGIEVGTGQGRLRIKRLQLPGKRPMSVSEVLNSRSFEGALLGG